LLNYGALVATHSGRTPAKYSPTSLIYNLDHFKDMGTSVIWAVK